ncbi:MAG: sugar MFS transporter [Bacteroidetes bacterium]|nr:sugar MFS transporter [Bacteroidota bacterium]
MKKRISPGIMIPVFATFYVMGFVDLVGMATGYVKVDFQLSDSMAQLLPSMVFLWFALLSIPTGLFQDRRGKKFTANLGMLLTALGLMVPFIHYSYMTAILGFMILGIGNSILQVSANPLLLDISSDDSKAANLSLSQFIKAGAAMLGPIIAAVLVKFTGNWRLIFPVYAGISILSVLWLYSRKIEESKPEKKPATFRSVLSLFKQPFVVVMVLSTFLMVGFDVGINSNIANFLMTKFSISLESASFGISFYFASLMAGRLAGAIVLRKINPDRFLIWSVVISLAGLAGIILSGNLLMTQIMIVVAGLGFSNTFPIVFAKIVERMPEYANELSSLIILSVIGGAVIPPVMGLVSDNVGVTASMFVLVFCMVYVLFASLYAIRINKTNQG